MISARKQSIITPLINDFPDITLDINRRRFLAPRVDKSRGSSPSVIAPL
jgi:hypothetical protein